MIRPQVSDFLKRRRTLQAGSVLLLAVVLLAAQTAQTFAQTLQTADASAAEAQVKKFGIGKCVKVTLAGGEQLKGHIWAISPDSFTVKIGKSSPMRSIPYSQVTEIKDPGPLVWMLICAAAAVAIVLIIRH